MRSSPTSGIFLYVAQAVERLIAVAYGNKVFWFAFYYRHISLCPQAVERVLAVAFVNELYGFESHYRHIFYVAQAVERVLEVAFDTNCVC